MEEGERWTNKGRKRGRKGQEEGKLKLVHDQWHAREEYRTRKIKRRTRGRKEGWEGRGGGKEREEGVKEGEGRRNYT